MEAESPDHLTPTNHCSWSCEVLVQKSMEMFTTKHTYLEDKGYCVCEVA